MKALSLLESVRWRLDDTGGDTGLPSAGYYARWQEDDGNLLWQNAELSSYLRQTLADLGRRFPRKEGTDRQIMLLAGFRFYDLDSDIVRIAAVTRKSDGRALVKVTTGDMQPVTRWNLHQRDSFSAEDWRSETGLPTHYLLSEQQGAISVYPKPDADHLDTLLLEVWSLYPDPPAWAQLASEASPSAELESVPDAFEEALIAGVCARAYRKRDADTYAPQLVQQFEAEFAARVGPLLSYRQMEAEACWADTPGDITPRTFFAR